MAKERYAELNVDTDNALKRIEELSVSIHCWQGDDVQGFESPDTQLSGGIAATGNYPGKGPQCPGAKAGPGTGFKAYPRQAQG